MPREMTGIRPITSFRSPLEHPCVDRGVASCSGQRMITNIMFSLMLPLGCLYAAIRGAAPERLVAAAFVAAAVGTALTGLNLPVAGQTRWGVFAVDTALFAVLVVIALNARRLWTLPVASFQLLTVLAHVVNIILPGDRPWPYAASITITSLLMPPLLAFGTYSHRRRLTRSGADPSWRSSSPLSRVGILSP